MSSTVVLHQLSDFSSQVAVIDNAMPRYWYSGQCPRSGKWLRLPRTALAETIAHGLMQSLATEPLAEGKMYGVLLVETPAGEKRVLKAFSGLLQGQSVVEGWVPPIPGRDRVALAEAHTLSRLDAIKQELLTLMQLPQRQDYQILTQEFEQRLQHLSFSHRQRQQQRQQQRQHLTDLSQTENISQTAAIEIALEQLNDQSRHDGMERRRLKQQRDAALRPLQQTIEQADARMRDLKQQRKDLSRQLQAQMHAVYCLTNFAGETISLQQATAGALPTGTGECCAPKLLHYAATHGLKPLAMAEFWWGASASGDRVPGEFYGACTERCQPLLGFLLSGLAQNSQTAALCSTRESAEDLALPILYEDEWLVAVNKPAGLLSVPGRYSDRQDSVLSRLRLLWADTAFLTTVHRLDQDTSGILLLARDPQTQRHLSQQFQRRQVSKVYEAIVTGRVEADQGTIDLPLWSDPGDRPRQKVDWQHGKPSITHFRVIAPEGPHTRIELMPVTGRTHQLRVHMADVQGLGMPIWGDRLYGCDHNNDSQRASRLHLHARELSFRHPQSGQVLHLQTGRCMMEG